MAHAGDLTAQEGRYRYVYDGNYSLPSVNASSYPPSYSAHSYYLPGQLGSTSGVGYAAPAPSPAISQVYRYYNAQTPAAAPSDNTGTADQFIQTAAAAEEEFAQEESKWKPLWGVISEIRFGAGRHDAAVVGRRKEKGIDLDAEFLFASPEVLDYIWSPRPTVGVHANIANKKYTSQVYAGLTWEWWPFDSIFTNFFFGMAYHNGKTQSKAPDIKELGSLWLFRESLAVGWQFYEGYNVSFYLDHVSNATLLAKTNEGMDTLGARFGYRF